ncbi:MAG: phosphatase PAP2 family protein [Gammaproteobacteria bacterium]|nr:phosphatase PAP2 family protein [Gammaproteobacteria bacterium]
MAASRAKRALLLALASLAVLKAGALLVCAGGRCRVPAFDTELLIAFNTWRTPLLDSAFAALTWAGSMYLLLPLALLLALIDTRPVHAWQRSFLPLALLSSWAVVHITKLLVARPRPAVLEPLIALPADGSFPSAHAAQAMALACAWLLRPGAGLRPWTALTLGLAVLGVGVSRLYLEVHYPSDVLFALAATALWVLALREAYAAVGMRS